MAVNYVVVWAVVLAASFFIPFIVAFVVVIRKRVSSSLSTRQPSDALFEEEGVYVEPVVTRTAFELQEEREFFYVDGNYVQPLPMLPNEPLDGLLIASYPVATTPTTSVYVNAEETGHNPYGEPVMYYAAPPVVSAEEEQARSEPAGRGGSS